MTDKEIITLFQTKDKAEQAFNLILKQYQQKLYYVVRRMVIHHEDANDVMQNVWIKIWRNLSNFKQESQLYTWLYRIAANETFSFLEQKRRKGVIGFGKSNEEGENYNSALLLKSAEYFDGDEIQRKLENAIQHLPDKQKMVFQLRYYDEMKYEDMSEMLGTSVGALKASYHHAVKKIEEFVNRD